MKDADDILMQFMRLYLKAIVILLAVAGVWFAIEKAGMVNHRSVSQSETQAKERGK